VWRTGTQLRGRCALLSSGRRRPPVAAAPVLGPRPTRASSPKAADPPAEKNYTGWIGWAARTWEKSRSIISRSTSGRDPCRGHRHSCAARPALSLPRSWNRRVAAVLVCPLVPAPVLLRPTRPRSLVFCLSASGTTCQRIISQGKHCLVCSGCCPPSPPPRRSLRRCLNPRRSCNVTHAAECQRGAHAGCASLPTVNHSAPAVTANGLAAATNQATWRLLFVTRRGARHPCRSSACVGPAPVCLRQVPLWSVIVCRCMILPSHRQRVAARYRRTSDLLLDQHLRWCRW